MQPNLPINAIKTEFLSALTKENSEQKTILLSAPPGAGKSTQLPLWLLEQAANITGKIYLLQPRRIAAKNIACYLASQLGETVGKRIGYRLRNEVKVSAETQLEVITEGILTQIVQNDPELSDCALVIFDEFHERSVHADLAFALCRDVQLGLRDDLAMVIMSATLNIDYLKNALPEATVLTSEGRSFPVDIEHIAPSTNRQWCEHALTQIKQKAFSHQGSTLVFLPGVADIRFLAENLTQVAPQDLLVCPLYGDLSLKAQQQALVPAPNGKRKIVLATNIAETSLTIEGVSLVIDSGLEKIAQFDHATLTNKLNLQAIAKSSAVQRAGRAGRLSAGRCIRLFSEEDFSRRAQQTRAEIHTTDLLPVLIEAARWGVTHLTDLPLIEHPLASLEQSAWQQLIALKIVNQQHRLTKHGEQVSQLSCHPRFAHMIMSALTVETEHGAPYQRLSQLACIAAAMLEERDLMPRQQSVEQADFRLRFFHFQSCLQRNDFRAKQILMQAERLYSRLAKLSSSINAAMSFDSLLLEQSAHQCGLLIALAYPERIAKQRGNEGSYIAFNGKGLNVNIEDPLIESQAIAVANCITRNLNARTANAAKQGLTVTLAASVDLETLISLNLFEKQQRTLCQYDAANDKVIAEKQLAIGEIVLTREKLPLSQAKDKIAGLWLQQLQKNGTSWLNFSDNVQQLLARWRWLNNYQPQLNFPKVDEQSLLDSCEQWFMPFVADIQNKKQLRKLDFSNMLLSLLDYQQQQLFKEVSPTHFVGPTKRRCPIRYHETQKSPIVSLPMQELYGQQTTPSVGENNDIPLVLELLSPAQRPIQTTQDLVTFWQGSYKDVQKDMKSRYPKHYWPDDPANAQATNKTKRHIKGA